MKCSSTNLIRLKAATEVPNEEQDDATFETSTSSCEYHLLTQVKLNKIVWDLK
jgi:hypothetical protein